MYRACVRFSVVLCFFWFSVLSNADTPEEHFRKAVDACSRHSHEECITEATLAITESEDPALASIGARSLLVYSLIKRNEEGDKARALSEIPHLLQHRDSRSEARFAYGMCLAANGRKEEAINEISEAIEMNGRLSFAYIERANLYLNAIISSESQEELRELTTNMCQDYDSAAQLAQPPQGVYFLKACALCQIGNYIDSCEILGEIYDSGWQHRHLTRIYCWTLRKCAFELVESSGNLIYSLSLCDIALELEPGNAYGWALRAMVNLRAGNLSAAMLDSQEAVERASEKDNQLVFGTRGTVFFMLHNMHAANSDYQLAIDSGEDSPFITKQYGATCLYLGKTTEAVECFTHALTTQSDDIVCLNMRATAYRLLDMNEEASADEARAEGLIVGRASLERSVQAIIRDFDTYSFPEEESYEFLE